MNILITNKVIDKGFTPIEFSMGDIAFASYYLRSEYKMIELFSRRRIGAVSKEVIKSLLLVSPKYADSKMIVWDDRMVINAPDIPNKYILILSYALAVSSAKVKTFENIVRHIDSINYENNKKKVYIQQAIKSMYAGFNDKDFLDTFFNTELFKKEIKALNSKVKVFLFNGKTAVQFDNVKIGNKEDGYLTYDQIFIYLDGWKIDGYVFRFKNFDYSSYWGLNLILHPEVTVPFCYNGNLDFHNIQDYKSYAWLLKENVVNPSENLIKIKTLISEFNIYRQLFDALKYKVTSREALSKLIFKEAKEK